MRTSSFRPNRWRCGCATGNDSVAPGSFTPAGQLLRRCLSRPLPWGLGWAALQTADFKLYLTLPHKVWAKPWNADAREVGSGAKAFEYLARYDSDAPWRLRGVAPAHMGCLSHLRSLGSAVQKTALDSSRITAVDEDSVRFR